MPNVLDSLPEPHAGNSAAALSAARRVVLSRVEYLRSLADALEEQAEMATDQAELLKAAHILIRMTWPT